MNVFAPFPPPFHFLKDDSNTNILIELDPKNCRKDQWTKCQTLFYICEKGVRGKWEKGKMKKGKRVRSIHFSMLNDVLYSFHFFHINLLSDPGIGGLGPYISPSIHFLFGCCNGKLRGPAVFS